MPLYRLDEPLDLDAPVLVAALDGWVDAGGAGTAAAEQLTNGGRVVATFDADAVFDYRVRRPTLDILDGRLVGTEWPELRIWASQIGGRDLLVLTGPEPDFRWAELAADVAELAGRLGVASWASLGSIPAGVAHTRPVPVLGTSSAQGLLPKGLTQGPAGQMRVPSAALSVLELAVSRSGIPAVGFFAQVPHYVSGAYPMAAVELLRWLGRYLDVDLPTGRLGAKALETRALLDAATAANDETRNYMEQLEKLADEEKLPSGDELIADIEHFLRRRGGDEGGGRLN